LFKMFNVLFFNVVTAIIVQNVTFYLVLMTCVWTGQPVTAETTYFISGAFLSMTYSLVTMIPYGSFHSSQIIAAMKRMNVLFKKLEVQVEKNLFLDSNNQ